jgi:hypothetical protein
MLAWDPVRYYRSRASAGTDTKQEHALPASQLIFRHDGTVARNEALVSSPAFRYRSASRLR